MTPLLYSSRLTAQAVRLNDSWIGHETKNLMLVTSETPLASPTQLRRILTFSGLRAPLVVLPTPDSH